MPARKETAKVLEPERDDVAPVLANSARAASILISLQIGSRILTFAVNQILVRFLSPELLGVSAQLELFSISVLTFSRESIRIALGRQGSAPANDGPVKRKEEREKQGRAQRAQEDINVSYVAVILGPVFSLVFTWFFFWRRPDPIMVKMPFFTESYYIYAMATMLELCMEPCFAIMAQQGLLGLRARAETSAAIARAIVTCGLAIVSSRSDLGLGPLPFAVGQLGFSVAINAVYFYDMFSRAISEGFSLLPQSIKADPSKYIFSRLPHSSTQVARNLYAQSGLKFLLTQGDSYMMAAFSDISTLGIYSLASNYGALLARMVFQPIEESSRGVLAGLLTQHVDNAPPASEGGQTEKPTTRSEAAKTTAEDTKLLSARKYLLTILRLYGLLSAGLATLLPAFAPILLTIAAGSRWAHTEAPEVLGLYAYYLPLLAFNGILEAFVAATASPSQLKTQNGAMVGFTAGFVGVAFLVLRIGEGGAKGVVAANAVNMAMRIVWSYGYVKRWFAARGCAISVADFAPQSSVLATGVAVAAALHWMKLNGDQSLSSLAQILVVGGAYGLFLLFTERRFMMECYNLFRPGRATTGPKDHKKSS